jgi:polyisoprenoid-binding protein YceI
MSTTPAHAAGERIATGHWRLDPAQSSVSFHVRHFYGLMTVKGSFARYEGTLELAADPAIELTIDAASLDTKQRKRDEHLRSADFFDVANHPEVRFVSDSVRVDGDSLMASGRLTAAGRGIPLNVEATLRDTGIDDELELEATVQADHRALGMTWSPLGILRSPSTLIVKGRLVKR